MLDHLGQSTRIDCLVDQGSFAGLSALSARDLLSGIDPIRTNSQLQVLAIRFRDDTAILSRSVGRGGRSVLQTLEGWSFFVAISPQILGRVLLMEHVGLLGRLAVLSRFGAL